MLVPICSDFLNIKFVLTTDNNTVNRLRSGKMKRSKNVVFITFHLMAKMECYDMRQQAVGTWMLTVNE